MGILSLVVLFGRPDLAAKLREMCRQVLTREMLRRLAESHCSAAECHCFTGARCHVNPCRQMDDAAGG
jgi:hypothetical protein